MQTVRAILLMILSMALLALSDMFIKLSALTAPVSQVMFAVSLGGTLLLAAYAVLTGERLFTRDALHPMVLWRNLCEITAALGMVTAIALIPLTTFAAIMQVAPIMVTLGAAVFLKEDVGWRRWAAVFAGLVGMLIVIRPGTEGFQPAAILAVIGVSALAMRDLITRLAPSHIPAITLSTWGFCSTIPAGLGLTAIRGDQLVWDATTAWYIAGAVLVTTTGYFFITTAMRMAPAAIVAPFRYTRLVFTTALGMMVFGERLDGPTIAGASLILAAGLYTFFRERRLALAAD